MKLAYLLEGVSQLFIIEVRLEEGLEPQGEAVEFALPCQRDEFPVSDRASLVQLDPAQVELGHNGGLRQEVTSGQQQYFRMATWRPEEELHRQNLSN